MDMALIAATLQIISWYTDPKKLQGMLPRILNDPTGELEKKIILEAWQKRLAELVQVGDKIR